ncbi:hypothetical protein [Luteithermobacter gelatinilyticus]|uniref:hypothetical protein n=1 Tax=Luteithermobacter gelatinilyticus TaxID=2582913 RepID=UPI0011070290|nr:hypothetical protein [Luteithermobacter gelatinilyticus]
MFKLGPLIKKTALVMGVLSFGLITTVEANAGGRHHKGGHHYKKHHYGHHYRSHYKHHKHHYRHHYRPHYRSHYYGHYGYGRYYHHPYRYGRGLHFRGHFHGHGSGDVALGLIAGGLLVYGLTQAAQSHPKTETAPAYVQQPVQGSGWVASSPQQIRTNSSCLQEREYQTTITVGNETVPAYGTACLQPDGSWKFGPAKAVPDYAR